MSPAGNETARAVLMGVATLVAEISASMAIFITHRPADTSSAGRSIARFLDGPAAALARQLIRTNL